MVKEKTSALCVLRRKEHNHRLVNGARERDKRTPQQEISPHLIQLYVRKMNWPPAHPWMRVNPNDQESGVVMVPLPT